MLSVATAAASGCRYKVDVESGAVVVVVVVVVVGEYLLYSIIELPICMVIVHTY